MGVESQIYNFDQVSISPGKDITRMLTLKVTCSLLETLFLQMSFCPLLNFSPTQHFLAHCFCDVRGLFQKYEHDWYGVEKSQTEFEC